MALGGHYYELFSTQAKRYITDDSSAEPSSAYDDKSDAGISGHGTQPDGKMPGHGVPFEMANGEPSDMKRPDADLKM